MFSSNKKSIDIIDKKCLLCEAEGKYIFNHDTKDHIKYTVSNDNLTLYDIKNQYKRCQQCHMVVKVENDKCILCKTTVSKYIRCAEPDCIFIMENHLCIYCPICSEAIMCEGHNDTIKYDELYLQDNC